MVINEECGIIKYGNCEYGTPLYAEIKPVITCSFLYLAIPGPAGRNLYLYIRLGPHGGCESVD
jgi:hypothetical protein